MKEGGSEGGEGGREGREGRGWRGLGEGAREGGREGGRGGEGGEGREGREGREVGGGREGGEGGREGGRGGEGEREGERKGKGRGGREGRGDCYTYNGTTVFKYLSRHVLRNNASRCLRRTTMVRITSDVKWDSRTAAGITDKVLEAGVQTSYVHSSNIITLYSV